MSEQLECQQSLAITLNTDDHVAGTICQTPLWSSYTASLVAQQMTMLSTQMLKRTVKAHVALIIQSPHMNGVYQGTAHHAAPATDLQSVRNC